MARMKYSYCSKVCEMACRMTKHLSMYKVQRGTARRTIPRRIQRRKNGFLTIPKIEATLLLAKQMEGIYSDKEEKGLYTNNIERMDPVGTAEYTKKADGEQVNPESVRNTCTRVKGRSFVPRLDHVVSHHPTTWSRAIPGMLSMIG